MYIYHLYIFVYLYMIVVCFISFVSVHDCGVCEVV